MTANDELKKMNKEITIKVKVKKGKTIPVTGREGP
jgi:hypothetical protein